MTRIGLHGVAGHMGRMLIRAVAERNDCVVSGGCDKTGISAIGEDLGSLAGLPPMGITVTDDAVALCNESDVIVDFSAAMATIGLIPTVVEHRTPLFIGTTGISDDHKDVLDSAGRTIPVLLGANMSVSVIVMYELVRMAAQKLGDEFDIEIFDFHPWDKIDSPSGTALELAHYAAAGRGVALDDVMVRARDGETDKRPRGGIGFASSRGGDVPGENTVFFAGPGQRLEITSRVTNHAAFAATTLDAAVWLHHRPPGFYEMDDMLKDRK